ARLTGAFVTEPSDASGMNLYDLERGGWSAAIVDAAQLAAAQLPDVHPSTDVVGAVLPQVAQEVGVPAGTPAVIGGGDGVCAAYGRMNLQAEKPPLAANGLLFLPYLLGERSPRWNPRARGAFIGLTIRHTRADMIRAVLEGITMNLRVIQDAFTTQGARIEAMRVIGGGARGRFWNRIMADVYGLP